MSWRLCSIRGGGGIEQPAIIGRRHLQAGADLAYVFEQARGPAGFECAGDLLQDDLPAIGFHTEVLHAKLDVADEQAALGVGGIDDDGDAAEDRVHAQLTQEIPAPLVAQLAVEDDEVDEDVLPQECAGLHQVGRRERLVAGVAQDFGEDLLRDAIVFDNQDNGHGGSGRRLGTEQWGLPFIPRAPDAGKLAVAGPARRAVAWLHAALVSPELDVQAVGVAVAAGLAELGQPGGALAHRVERAGLRHQQDLVARDLAAEFFQHALQFVHVGRR